MTTATERLRQRLFERAGDNLDAKTLMDEASLQALDLSNTEAAILMALLISGGLANEAANTLGLPVAMVTQTANALVERELLARTDNGWRYELKIAERLNLVIEREPRQPPIQKIALRPLREQVVMVARSDGNPVRGAARAFTFVFGRPVKNFPVLGKIVNALGVDETARFFLQHSMDAFDGDPLYELLPLALAVSKGNWRPEELGPTEAGLAEQKRQEEAAWRDRVQKWLFREALQAGGGAALWDYPEYFNRPAQLEADKKQYAEDMTRYRKEQQRQKRGGK